MTHDAKLVDGKIESREPCPGAPGEVILKRHCWHKTGGHGFTAGPDSIRTEDYVCCYCRKSRHVKYRSQQPEGHGRYAPRVLVQVSDTEDP